MDHKTASLLTAKMAPNHPLLLSTAIPSKAEAKLQAALDYLTDINVGSQNRSDK